jgi:hypothetical protein
MLTRMSDSPDRDPRAPAAAEGPGVLAGLSRTRPQRASARRASARRAASRAAKPSTTTPGKALPSKALPSKALPSKALPRQAIKRPPARSRPIRDEPAPRQGFEAEPDSLDGAVQPPSGTELVTSAAELAGELAKAGVGAGARVLRDFLSRLPG